MGSGKMEIRFFISLIIMISLMFCVFIFDFFPGNHVAKGIAAAVILFTVEGGWAILEVRNLIKQGKQDDVDNKAVANAQEAQLD